MRGGCGGDVVLETVNASRAFLTMDSGFPLAQLEQSLRTNRPFDSISGRPQVPVLFGAEYWLVRARETGRRVHRCVPGGSSMCRLYLGLAKLDPETAEEVRKAMPLQRIRAFAHVLDFFGGMFRIRNGEATVPGGARSRGGLGRTGRRLTGQGRGVFRE